MQTVNVKMKTGMAGATFSYRPGQVIPLLPAHAFRFCDSELAEPADDDAARLLATYVPETVLEADAESVLETDNETPQPEPETGADDAEGKETTSETTEADAAAGDTVSETGEPETVLETDGAGGGGDDQPPATAGDEEPADEFGGLFSDRVRELLTAAGITTLEQLDAVPNLQKLHGIGKKTAEEIKAARAAV